MEAAHMACDRIHTNHMYFSRRILLLDMSHFYDSLHAHSHVYAYGWVYGWAILMHGLTICIPDKATDRISYDSR